MENQMKIFIEQSIGKIIELVSGWAENSIILGVQYKSTMIKHKKFNKVDNWIYKLQIIKKKNCNNFCR